MRRLYPFLMISILVVAFSNALILNAKSYDCYSVYDDDDGSYSWVWAWAYGCIDTPSDGNIYNTDHAGGGDIYSANGGIIHFNSYIERGCSGDVYISYTYSLVDPEGDGTFYIDAIAAAYIYAGPCGSL